MKKPTLSPPLTSPYNIVVQTPDTAVGSHHVLNALYRTEHLSAGRDAVLHDLGSVPEAPWKSFLKILPPSPLGPGQAERVVVALNKDEIVDNERRKTFATEPSNDPSRESEVFRPLDHLFDVIVAACETEIATKPGPYKWTTITDITPKSARKSTCKSGAWLVLASATHAQSVEDNESYYWEDCCLSAQFKKGTSLNDIHDARTRTAMIRRFCLPFRMHRTES